MCEHKFMDDFGARAFKGADAVRLCVQCDYAEARVDGRWIDFNKYLDRLGPSRESADTVITQRPKQP